MSRNAIIEAMNQKQPGLLHGNGCKHYQDCLSCPFDACVFDDQFAPQRYRTRGREHRVVEARRTGLTVEAISKKEGLSVRSVYRILAGMTNGHCATDGDRVIDEDAGEGASDPRGS